MDKNSSHLAGEYFVAAELYRRGFSIGMTIGNAKAIDLFANYKNKTVPIQVKAIRNKGSIGWPMLKSKIFNGVVYIFINLNDLSNPQYFIATPTEVKRKIKQYKTRGVINLSSLNGDKFLDRWDKIGLFFKSLK